MQIKIFNKSGLEVLLAILILICVLGLGYFVEQSSFPSIALFYGIGFLVYVYILSSEGQLRQWHWWLKVAIVLRLSLLFGMPTLSDDVYRFIWDGRLILNGINPFVALPAFYIDNPQGLAGINEELFALLNSPEYFTIYPPFAQASFALATGLFFKSILGSTLVLKLLLFLCEFGTIWLLPKLLAHFQFPKHNSLIYALNPLVIIETVGNLHYEAAMVFFLLAALYALSKQKLVLSSFLFAVSISAKLLTILFLPFFWSRLGWKRSLRYYLLVISLTVIMFLPLVNLEFIRGFSNSLDLYFRKFEFNGSIYYSLRWLGYQIKGYNIIQTIGPRLGMLAVLAIGFYGLLDKKKDFRSIFSRMLLAICLYLFLATTVHPWYAILPILLCGFTTWRFPIVWSALIWLTYINYSYATYQENLWIVALEYVLVWAFLLRELLKKWRNPGKVTLFARPYNL